MLLETIAFVFKHSFILKNEFAKMLCILKITMKNNGRVDFEKRKYMNILAAFEMRASRIIINQEV